MVSEVRHVQVILRRNQVLLHRVDSLNIIINQLLFISPLIRSLIIKNESAVVHGDAHVLMSDASAIELIKILQRFLLDRIMLYHHHLLIILLILLLIEIIEAKAACVIAVLRRLLLFIRYSEAQLLPDLILLSLREAVNVEKGQHLVHSLFFMSFRIRAHGSVAFPT